MIPRLLISAYACEPHAGSEPGAGWHLALAAAECAQEATIVTRGNNAEAVRQGLMDLKVDHVDVVDFDLAPWLQRVKRRIPAGRQSYYIGWQLAATRFLSSLHRDRGFDLAYHATFAVDWMPCALAGVAGLPFVWGPVSGPSVTPTPLLRYLGARGGLDDLTRRIYTSATTRFVGQHVAGRAKLALLQNTDAVAAYGGVSKEYRLCPNAAADATAVLRRDPQPGHVVGVGRLLPWKGWSLAIHALALCPPHVTLTIAGEGPDRRRLERLSRALGLSDRVEFLGWVGRDVVMRELARASCFLFPSFHDQSPWSVAEAITEGLPVVALDLAGPSTLVRGAGGTPLDPCDGRLVEHMAAQMTAPPPSLDAAAWTLETLRERIQSAILHAYAEADADGLTHSGG